MKIDDASTGEQRWDARLFHRMEPMQGQRDLIFGTQILLLSQFLLSFELCTYFAPYPVGTNWKYCILRDSVSEVASLYLLIKQIVIDVNLFEQEVSLGMLLHRCLSFFSFYSNISVWTRGSVNTYGQIFALHLIHSIRTNEAKWDDRELRSNEFTI